MAKFDEVPLSSLPDAGTLTGDELVYVLQPGKVSRRSTVARIRQGLATLADLAGVSIGEGNVPPGGAAGAALIKASADSYDTMWDTTGGTGHVPDPAEEPDGRKLVTQTGGLVYVDDDPNLGLLPDPANEPDGLMVATEAGEYVLAEIPEPPPPPVTSVAGHVGAVTLTKTDVGLNNVDNTADLAKPVSTATSTAIGNAVTTFSPDATTLRVVDETGWDAIVSPDPDTIYFVVEDAP